MPKARVVIDDRFREFGADLERAVERGLGHAAGAVIAAGQAVPSDYNIQAIKAGMAATPVERTRFGWQTVVYDRDFRAIFFERGTYLKRGARKSARGRQTAAAGNRGVKAVHFMRNALREVFPRVVEMIAREVR